MRNMPNSSAAADGASAGGEVPLSVISLSGAFAGLANSAVIGPVELVKNRLQVQYEAAGSAAAAQEYRGARVLLPCGSTHE